MQNGRFIWKSYRDGRTWALNVRDCPDPAAARLMLERDVVEGPVRWESTK